MPPALARGRAVLHALRVAHGARARGLSLRVRPDRRARRGRLDFADRRRG